MFKYVLSDTQYRRFQHSTNDVEIRALCESAGVEVTDEKIVDGVETWHFRGRCAGAMALVRTNGRWECWIRVTKKP